MSQMESIVTEFENHKKDTIQSQNIKFKVLGADEKIRPNERVVTMAEAKRYHYKVKKLYKKV